MLKYLYILSTILSLCFCQYADQTQYNQQYDDDQGNYKEKPKYNPQILSHKQSLNHDGNFKYAFASDNGLLQGETIAPDGSRTGGFAYVDPSGKKISVKYVAGKEGFRIVEGDHIPRAHPLIANNQQPHPGYMTLPQNQQNRHYPVPLPPPPRQVQRPVYQEQRPFVNYDQYRPQIQKPRYQIVRPVNKPINEDAYEKPRIVNRPVPSERANDVIPFQVAQRYRQPREETEAEDEEPGRPHSFGSGYSFEFGG